MTNADVTGPPGEDDAARQEEPADKPADASSKLPEMLARMQKAQRAAGPPTYEQRARHLERLSQALLRKKHVLADAISRDFGHRSKHESFLAEIFVAVEGIGHTKAHLREWMEPSEREVGWAFAPARAEVLMQPLGVVGVISPWNYPVLLAVSPLTGALAAGNRVLIKPSELVPETSEAIRDLVAETFDPDHVAVVTGGPDVGMAFSSLTLDHLVFTGSTRVGKAVMRAAAEHLTPVTLELGGKSPALVGEECSLRLAAKTIAQGKFFNAGQTCIAPDYALVPAGMKDSFVAEMKAAIGRMYPTLAQNPDYTSVVSDAHYARLTAAVADAKEKGATIIEVNPGNETLEPSARKLAPTLVVDATDDMLLMQEEIFGPILPVRTYKAFDEAIDYVNDHPRPLALYYFGANDDRIQQTLRHTISGGVCVNATMLHAAQDDLPFGGVGPSGMGHYHAREGFEALSKKKPVFYQSRLNASGLLAPPFGKLLDNFLRVLLGK
jgi:coniferyl-aldehyde dehydrogenase